MTTVFFSFPESENARRFVAAVLDHGSAAEDVSILAKDDNSWLPTDEDGQIEQGEEHGLEAHKLSKATVGAAAGAGVGVGVGVLASLAALFVPGVGWVVGAGGLAAALATAASGMGAGAIAGGMYGYMRDVGMPDDTSEGFATDYHAHHVIVSVAIPPDRLPLLREIADKYHASRRFGDLSDDVQLLR